MERRVNVGFSAIITLIVLVCICTASFAADEKITLNDFRQSDQFREGRVVSSEIEIGKADGGPTLLKYEIASASPYPKGTVLHLDATLSVESGYFEIAFLFQGKPSFVLKATPNKPAKGKGKVNVTDDGLYLQHRINSKSATNVRYSFTVTPTTER